MYKRYVRILNCPFKMRNVSLNLKRDLDIDLIPFKTPATNKFWFNTKQRHNVCFKEVSLHIRC